MGRSIGDFMSRLDRHIASVRTTLSIDLFFRSLAWALVIVAGAALVGVIVHKLVQVQPPKPVWWIYAGLGAALVAAIAWAISKSPTVHDVAVRIDEKLKLKEKFSTALYCRGQKDEFALAALSDAERTAEKVDLKRQFKLTFPNAVWGAMGLALVALLIHWYVSPMDLFGREDAQRRQAQLVAKQEEAKRTLEQALAVVNAVPPAVANDDQIKLAKDQLIAQLSRPIEDPAAANRTAMKALSDVENAIKDQIKGNQRFAEAQNNQKLLQQKLNTPVTEEGPVADARRNLQQGDFSAALDDLQKSVENFDKMSKEQQEQQAQQMQQLAQQLQQMAQDPDQQRRAEEQMQKMGMEQEQIKQAQQLMQQAAQGDQQAQQQLQQMAQQAMQQMNNGQGPTPQQQQAVQQMMQQLQAQASTQQQAQQLAQAAQQLSQAMQQASQQAQQQQQQPQQQGNVQQQQQANQGQGQQQPQQQQQANQGQQQPAQQGQQQMQQGLQQMQNALGQMQAIQADAQQLQALQQAAQNCANQAMNNMGQGGQGQGQGQGQGAGQGQMPAPFGIKPEQSASPEDEKGRILASSLVQAGQLKGDAKAQLQQVIERAKGDQTDEIDQDRVSRAARKVVRDYFNSMQPSASPSTQPAR
jgi:chemotaxis protein histidine kinase CheA